MATKPSSYTNPAFCQQSEFYNQRALSPQRNIRQSPVGAQTCHRLLDTSICVEDLQNANIEEQEFYEEVVVDKNGFITDKKFVVVAQNNEGKKYIQIPQAEETKDSRYGAVSPQPKQTSTNQKQRYEYIPLQEQNNQLSPGHIVQHRYAVIDPPEEETDLSVTNNNRNGRYALVPAEELQSFVINNRYEYIPDVPNKNSVAPLNITGRYDYPLPPCISPTKSTRYEYPSHQCTPPNPRVNRYEYIQPALTQTTTVHRGGNPIATQKLHELLSTPKKPSLNSLQVCKTPQQRVLSPQISRRALSPVLATKDAFQSPPKISPQKYSRAQVAPNSRAQQKLNYTIGTRYQVADKRDTAIVAPICSSPIQSVYSETTYSNKSESWMNLSMRKTPVQATLGVAALMMLMCGGVTSGLCFYMISDMGRLYYLDFSIVAGFTCLVLGLLGFRSKNVYWLPNRNYISGYIVLSVFSLLTCAGLVVLLVKQPRAGTPLADMTSGAVCGFSVLSLVLATMGVVSSYCCKYPPPDNRVQHCSPGFTV